ncbi:MAG: carbohydrate kinase family protein [Clostridiales bacterium]|nr:carbohydrate kinase family protein [Clostridiales bacterium]
MHSRDGTEGLRVLVVGGANTDILGMADARTIAGDSSPGHIRVSTGGVGHNIAINLVRMGATVNLVTAFGGDERARHLILECRKAGVDISHSVFVDEAPGSTYVAVIDRSGNPVAAVSDMSVLEYLTPAAIRVSLEGLEAIDGVVVDANPAPATLSQVFESCSRVPVFADCVSVAKAQRLVPFLTKIKGLKASAAEAEALTGEPDPALAAELLASRGPDRVWVTAGADGVFWTSGTERGYTQAPTGDVVNATGAGDAFMAGVVFATLSEWSVVRTARFAVGAAALTLATGETVSEDMSVLAASTAVKKERE